MPEQIHFRTCPLCEAMCGLNVHVDGGRVTRIRGDEEDVWSRGYICPKGTTLGEIHHDPDRLRAPVVRRGGELVEASWPEADFLVESSRGLAGVIGARMSGAGWGGCCLALLDAGDPPAHVRALVRAFATEFGREPRVWHVRPAAGARLLSPR